MNGSSHSASGDPSDLPPNLINADQITMVDDPPPVRFLGRTPSMKGELSILVVCLGIVVLACFLKVDTSSMVVVPYFEKQLPATCPMKSFTDIGCPGCGLSRGMIFIAQGEFYQAWMMNPATFLIALIILYQIPIRIFRLYQISKNLPVKNTSYSLWLAWIVVISLISNWVVKLTLS